MTKNIFTGFKYKDLLTGEILTVEKVDKEGIHFEGSNLVVKDLTTFEEVEATLDESKVGEFSLKDGVLYYEDSKIESGTLAIEEIVATFKNKVILKVKSLNKKTKNSAIPEGKYELFVYNVVHDKFFKTQESFDELSVLHDENGFLLLNGKTFVEHTISKESFEELENSTSDTVISEQLFSGDVKVGVVQQSLIAFRYGIYDDSFTYSGELKDVNVYKEDDDVVITGLSDESVKLYNVDGADVSATVKGRLKVMQFICKPIFDEYSDEKGDIQEVEFDSFEINIIEGDEVKEVKPTHDGRHSLLIITENGFIYSNANYNPRYASGQTAKDVVDNYPFFVGLEPGTHRNLFTLSNEKREIVKIEVVKTHDRGYTTNVIDN